MKIEANKSCTISYVCRETTTDIHHLMGKIIGDVPLIVAETMVISEFVRTATHHRLVNIDVENDLQIAVNSITGKIKAPSHIFIK